MKHTLSTTIDMCKASRAFFDSRSANWTVGPRIEKARRLLVKYELRGRGLEIGTGTGCALHSLPGCVGLDFSLAMLRNVKLANPLVCSRAVSLPFYERAFDYVVCYDAFAHFVSQSVIREIRRVLVVGGKLLIIHDIPRREVNHIHRTKPAPINKHLLPPLNIITKMLQASGARILSTRDSNTFEIFAVFRR